MSQRLPAEWAETHEMVVITKSYDLILWSCEHTGRFPRSRRFVLGERSERNLYDLLETLIEAKYTRENSDLLGRANLRLEILRFQMRQAKDLNCLKLNRYATAAETTSASPLPRCLPAWSHV